MLDLIVANVFHASHGQLTKDLSCALLLLVLQSLDGLVDQLVLGLSDLVFFMLSSALFLLLLHCFFPVFLLSFDVSVQVGLDLLHLELCVLHSLHFIIQFTFDLLKNAHTL